MTPYIDLSVSPVLGAIMCLSLYYGSKKSCWLFSLFYFLYLIGESGDVQACNMRNWKPEVSTDCFEVRKYSGFIEITFILDWNCLQANSIMIQQDRPKNLYAYLLNPWTQTIGW